MKFLEFQQAAKRTLPNLNTSYGTGLHGNLLNLIHTRLGMVSELDELITALRKNDDVNVGEELCDILWYLANDLNLTKEWHFITDATYNYYAAMELGKEPMSTDGGFKLDNEFPWLSALVFNISILADLVKKDLAYQKQPDVLVYTKAVSYLFGAINNIALLKSIDLEVYMERNIAKLKVRYPDKFTEEGAINRDLDKERSALEGN